MQRLSHCSRSIPSRRDKKDKFYYLEYLEIGTMDEISAAAAYDRSRSNGSAYLGTKSVDTNYTLTMRRLFETIRRESEAGKRRIAFLAPRFVMDGTLADPVLLAKQIKVKLVRLGYTVDRNGDTLHISWDRQEAPAPPPTPAPQARTTVKITGGSGLPPRGYAGRGRGGVAVRRVKRVVNT